MVNQYMEMKRRHEKEFNAFPMMFAFSNRQFEEGMEKLGLNPEDTDKVYKFGGGGFYRRSDAEELKELMDRHNREYAEAIEADVDGEGFVLDMFTYELANHEFCITYDYEPTLNALGLTADEVNNSEKLFNSLMKARKIVLEESE